jgi:hypothetical protein
LAPIEEDDQLISDENPPDFSVLPDSDADSDKEDSINKHSTLVTGKWGGSSILETNQASNPSAPPPSPPLPPPPATADYPLYLDPGRTPTFSTHRKFEDSYPDMNSTPYDHNKGASKMSFVVNSAAADSPQDFAKTSWEEIKASFSDLAPNQRKSLSEVKLPELRLEPFEPGKTGARDWLTRFSLYIQTKGLAEETKPAVLGLFLKGSAWQWYLTLAAEIRNTWERLAEEFLRQFEDQKFRFVRLNELMSKEQKAEQSVEAYAAEVLELAMALSISEPERLSFFIRGLQPEIRAHVLRAAPPSYSDAVSQAKLYEATAKLTPSTPSAAAIIAAIHQLGVRPQSERDVGGSKSSTADSRLESMVESLTKQMRSITNQLGLVNDRMGQSPNFRGTRTFRGRVVCSRGCPDPHHESVCPRINEMGTRRCFNCDSPMHLARECPQRYQQSADRQYRPVRGSGNSTGRSAGWAPNQDSRRATPGFRLAQGNDRSGRERNQNSSHLN